MKKNESSAGNKIDAARAENLVLELMAIPGRSGEEREVAEFITHRLVAAGADRAAIKTDNAFRSTAIRGNTGNLIFKLPGTIKAPRRMLSAHMDTVPLCVGCQPKKSGQFVRSANSATALGADDRAGCATILTAALEILEKGLPHPPLTYCWFIQEEIGLQGARYLQTGLLGKPAMCFNWDGGSPTKLTIGATGGYRFVIEIRGLASHAGIAPEQGVSAITIASLAIADLHRDGWLGLVVKGKDRGTANVGVIQGGDATNVITDRVQVRAEARSHNSTFRNKIVARIEDAFRKAAAEVKSTTGHSGEVMIDGKLDYESFQLDASSPCVLAATQAIRGMGAEAELGISNGGVDANWLNAHGIPTVTLGCGQMNVHMTSERLDLKMFHSACKIARTLATGGE